MDVQGVLLEVYPLGRRLMGVGYEREEIGY
jgi:hypothetical protein